MTILISVIIITKNSLCCAHNFSVFEDFIEFHEKIFVILAPGILQVAKVAVTSVNSCNYS